MSLKRPSPRLNAEEQLMLGELWEAWKASGLVLTESDVIRRCLRLAYNHRQRSNGKPESPAIPGDIGGELRTGRPRRQMIIGAYNHSIHLPAGGGQ